MAVRDLIRDLLASRGAQAQGGGIAVPAGDIAVDLPAEDAQEAADVAGTPAVDHVSGLVAIRYHDSKGTCTTRRVTVRRVWELGDRLIIDTYCHEREAPRRFDAARIEEVIDVATGEKYDDAAWFLRHHVALDPAVGGLTADDTRRAIDRARPDLAILAFLAACDGSFDPVERDAILDYVAQRCGDLDFDRARIAGHIARLHPDEDSFFSAIETLTARADADLAALGKGAVAVVEADGVLDDAKAKFIAAMREALAEHGVSI
jgi:hypothetical protein